MKIVYDQLELAMAADPAFAGEGFYLDTETGAVLGADDYSTTQARKYDRFDEVPAGEKYDSFRLAWALLWDKGSIEADVSEGEAEQIGHFLERFVPVPHFDTAEEYADMEMFAAQVEDAEAAEALQEALGGRGAFRRFKDALYAFPAVREAWFRFQAGRRRERMDEWLREEGVLEEGAPGERL